MKRFGLFLFLLMGTFSFLYTQNAFADNFTFYANNTKDELLDQKYPGISQDYRHRICLKYNNTGCSLREAVRVAQETLRDYDQPTPAAVTIKLLGSRTHGNYKVSVNDIYVKESMDFQGSGDSTDQTVIDASGLGDGDTVFNINDGGEENQRVKFLNIVFINGNRTSSQGGAVVVSSNHNAHVGFYYCNFWRNSANAGGAIVLLGYATLEIYKTQFSENSAGAGGAIFADHGHLIITDSTFLNNKAQAAQYGNDIYLTGDAALSNNSGILKVVTSENSKIIINNITL